MGDLYAREARSIATLAQLRFFPLALVGGQGARLTDDEGRTLIDFGSSWGTVGLGHAHPAVADAVAAALHDQAGASYLSTANKPTIELAERLLSLVPSRAAGRVWFGHSGSDANETVARAAVAATGRPRILAFSGAYHGGTVGSAAVSGHPAQAIPRAPGLALVPYPDVRAHGSKASRIALDALDRLLAGPVSPGEVAAFFTEPIQSDGGMLVPPEDFFRDIELRCREHGILLVSDEVKVGLGRTGSFHSFQQWGIEPDVVVLGKGLGNGLPISAVIGPEALMTFSTAFSFQTLHGNPVCAAAALAVLDAVERDDLTSRAAELGAYMLSGLRDIQARHPLVGDVRGKGLAIGVELVRNQASREPARRETAMTVYRAFERGLVLFYVGVHSNVLEITPPLTLDRGEADLGLQILDDCLSDIEAGRINAQLIEAFSGW